MKIAAVPAEIRTEHLTNTSEEPYLYASTPLGISAVTPISNNISSRLTN
jgi:hypothetical protein